MNNQASFIEIVTAVFAAGESRLFALTGQYFEIIDATFPVDVTLSDIYGAQRGLMKSAEASFNLKGTEFGVVQITSASAQTIRFAYGTGEAGTRRAAGAVSIVGTVPVDLIAADVDAIRRPELPTANWNSNAQVTGNIPQTVFAAAANVNGAILLMAQGSDLAPAGGTLMQSFVAKATAPATPFDGDVLVLTEAHVTASSNIWSSLSLKSAQRIAAGLGLYFISSATGSAGYGRACRYVLL